MNVISIVGRSILRTALITAALTLAAARADAALIVHALSNTTVTAGQSSFFDVFLELTSGSEGLAGYQLELNVTGPTSGVKFTGIAAADNPMFPTQTPALTSGGPSLPGSSIQANDFILSGENSIATGKELLRILFQADAGSQGIYTVSLNAEETFLSNGGGTNLSLQLASGTITVTPEPSALMLSLAAAAGCALFALFRHRSNGIGLSRGA